MAWRGWLHVLPMAFQQRLVEHCHERRFGTGESIVEVGDEAGGIYGVLDGAVGCWISSPYNEQMMAHVARQADWFGEGPAVTGEARTMSFRALEPTLLLQLTLPAIRQLTAELPETAHCISVLSETAARSAIRAISDLLIPDAERRLAAVLLRVTGAEEGLAAMPPEGVRLSQTELGEMAGFSRHHANRLLLKMQARGLVRLGYQRIIVLELERLVLLAKGELGGGQVVAA